MRSHVIMVLAVCDCTVVIVADFWWCNIVVFAVCMTFDCLSIVHFSFG